MTPRYFVGKEKTRDEYARLSITVIKDNEKATPTGCLFVLADIEIRKTVLKKHKKKAFH